MYHLTTPLPNDAGSAFLSYVYDNDCLEEMNWDEAKNASFRHWHTNRNMSQLAAAGKRLHMLQWLHKRDMLDLHSTDSTKLTALHLVVFQAPPQDEHNIAEEDAACLKCLIWLHSVGLLDTKLEDGYGCNLTWYALANGYFETLNWLVSQDLFVPKSPVLKRGLTIICIESGWVKQLKWLHSREMLEIFVPDDEDGNHIGHVAARLGAVKVMKWLYKEGIVNLTRVNMRAESIAAWAVLGGSSKMLRWLAKKNLLHKVIVSATELSDAASSPSAKAKPSPANSSFASHQRRQLKWKRLLIKLQREAWHRKCTSRKRAATKSLS